MDIVKSMCGVVVMAVLLPLQMVFDALEKWCMVGMLCASRWGRDNGLNGANGSDEADKSNGRNYGI